MAEMKTSARPEWNGLPGYLASLRLPGTTEAADFNLLDLGFDAATAEEFLKEPVRAIRRKFESKNLEDQNRGEDLLLTLVLKFGCILVMAERERAAAETEKEGGS
jgi:hypothetical protein